MANNGEISNPGLVHIDYVKITNFDRSYSNNIDLFTIAEFNIYEDILSPYITGDILLRDTQSLIEVLPIIGDEFLDISFRIPQRSDQDAIILKNMRVYKISDRSSTGWNNGDVEVYRLHFISQEGIANLNQKVSRSFVDQTVDNVVNTLWKDYVAPSTSNDKKLTVSKTSGKVNFIVPSWSPFAAINWLATNMAVTSKGNADFIFYEATNKAKGPSCYFVSLDELMQQEQSFTLVFNPQNYYFNIDDTSNPKHRDRRLIHNNIEDYRYTEGGDVFHNTMNGQYSQTWIFHDILRKKFVISKPSHQEDFLGAISSIKPKQKFYGDVTSKEAKPLQVVGMPGNVNTFPKKISKTKAINNDISTTGESNTGRKTIDYISKREETKNLETSDMGADVLFARKFKFQQISNYEILIDNIPGTDEIQLAKTINFKKPHITNNEALTKKINSEYDKYLSGKYLVSSLQHRIVYDHNNNIWMYWIAITAFKDFFESPISFEKINA